MSLAISEENANRKNPLLFINQPVIAQSLVKHQEKIQQVIIRNILMTNKFDLVFSQDANIQETNFRVYEFKSSIMVSSTYPNNFIINLEIYNPKISKNIKSKMMDNIPDRRVLHTLRYMIFKLINGDNSKIPDEVPEEIKIEAPKEAPQKPLKEIKKVNVLEQKKTETINNSHEKKKNKLDADDSKPQNVFTNFGVHYQDVSIEADGELEFVSSQASGLNFSFLRESYINDIFSYDISLNYVYLMRKSLDETPAFYRLGLDFNYNLEMTGYVLGVYTDHTHLFNREGLNKEVKIYNFDITWLKLGAYKKAQFFSRAMKIDLSFLKSFYTSNNLKNSELSGYGLNLSILYNIRKQFDLHLGVDNFRNYIVSDYEIAMKDDRIFVGLVYHLGS